MRKNKLKKRTRDASTETESPSLSRLRSELDLSNPRAQEAYGLCVVATFRTRLQQTRLVRKRLPPVREARRGKHPDGAPPHSLRPGGVQSRWARVELVV